MPGLSRHFLFLLASTRFHGNSELLARRAAEHLPAAQLDVVPGAGHMLPFEAPDVVAERLAALLPGWGVRTRACRP